MSDSARRPHLPLVSFCAVFMVLCSLPATAGAAVDASVVGTTVVVRGDGDRNHIAIKGIRGSAADRVRIKVRSGALTSDDCDANDTKTTTCVLPAPITAILVRGGGANDRIESVGPIPVSMWGERGHDELIGGTGGDVLRGGTGDDTLRGRRGGDQLFGGPGFDRLYVSRGNDRLDAGGDKPRDGVFAVDSVHVSGLPHIRLVGDTVRAKGVWSRIAGVSHVVLQGSGRTDVVDARRSSFRVIADLKGGADRFLGSTFRDSVDGGPGDDTLLGRGGKDHLEGASGRDVIRGGAGKDTILADDGRADRSIRGGPGRDICVRDEVDPVRGCERSRIPFRQIWPVAIEDRTDEEPPPTNVDVKISGDRVVVTGDVQPNLVRATGSRGPVGDAVVVRVSRGTVSSNDCPRLDARRRRCVVPGGVSRIVIFGEAGADRLRVDGPIPARLVGGGDEDRLVGGSGDDRLQGGSGDDHLDGRLGDDHLQAGWGVDLLRVSRGNDLLDGGRHEFYPDVASIDGARSVRVTGRTVRIDGQRTRLVDIEGIAYRGTRGRDTFDARTSRIPIGAYLGRGNDWFAGSRHGDDVSAGAGDDVVSTRGGADWVEAGPGRDSVRTGRGPDYFNMRDGRADRVASGGSGSDECLTDEKDATVSCEYDWREFQQPFGSARNRR